MDLKRVETEMINVARYKTSWCNTKSKVQSYLHRHSSPLSKISKEDISSENKDYISKLENWLWYCRLDSTQPNYFVNNYIVMILLVDIKFYVAISYSYRYYILPLTYSLWSCVNFICNFFNHAINDNIIHEKYIWRLRKIMYISWKIQWTLLFLYRLLYVCDKKWIVKKSIKFPVSIISYANSYL